MLFTCVVAVSSVHVALSIFNEFPQEIVEVFAVRGGPCEQHASLFTVPFLGNATPTMFPWEGVGPVCLTGGLLNLEPSRRKAP